MFPSRTANARSAQSYRPTEISNSTPTVTTTVCQREYYNSIQFTTVYQDILQRKNKPAHRIFEKHSHQLFQTKAHFILRVNVIFKVFIFWLVFDFSTFKSIYKDFCNECL